jgi:glycosyltransferase involved in cell wall biosynthesis
VRVGVYLGDYAPQLGGGRTFVGEVVEGFFAVASESRHTFTFFARSAAASSLRGMAKGGDIAMREMRSDHAVDRLLGGIRLTFPLASRLVGMRGALARAAERAKVDCLWFVGGGAHEALDIPYIATVWDLQHRTHPWFPEVSANGTWDYREERHARFLRRATQVITGTEIGAEQLGWYYQIPRDRITLLRHPTPRISIGGPADLHIDPRIRKLGDLAFVFYPAQFWAHKNHANLLLALKILREDLGTRVDLVLTGSDKGNLRFVKELCEKLGLASCVHFLGFVSADELAFLYRKASVLAYVSMSGPENLPPLEAFSCGCPVVNADYPGAKEQLGGAAVFVDPHTPSEIAAALSKVLSRESYRQELIQMGRKRAAEWTAQDYVRGVFDIVERFKPIRRAWAATCIDPVADSVSGERVAGTATGQSEP